ncbi:hypothetical protein HMPREF9997_01839 [Corynebacterium durum F0235]|uniref:Uncharacterized protein n=1 Tax=Corynebacterium durum F0235 TaxID=1035195 RepID=L1MDP5_9CORY|nr:hypothetical protein HMPREF9997_01839 [Corynebacterium durum F0235]
MIGTYGLTPVGFGLFVMGEFYLQTCSLVPFRCLLRESAVDI